jgi:hypothetical protein
MPGLEMIFSNPTGTVNLGKKILECVGILESIDSKLNKLIQCELNSGFDALNMAARASCKESQNKFLWDALEHFRKSRQLEKNERLCAAYLGSIFCLNCLGQRENTIYILKQFAYTDFGFSDWEKVGTFFKKEGLNLFIKTAFNPLYLIQYYLLNSIIWRKEIFEEIFQLPSNFQEYRKFIEIKNTVNLDSLNFRIQYGEKQLKKIENIINKLKTQRIKDPEIICYEHDKNFLMNKLNILYLRKEAFEYLENLEKQVLQIQPDNSEGLT